MTERRLPGKWWLPSTPDKKVAGFLVVTGAGQCQVELADLLYTPGAQRIDAYAVALTDILTLLPLAHGTADGKPVSLIDADGSRWSQRLAALAPSVASCK